MQKTPDDLANKIKRIDHTIKFGIEAEISKKHKEQMGQFFTPGNVIEMMLEILGPHISDKIVDAKWSVLIRAYKKEIELNVA